MQLEDVHVFMTGVFASAGAITLIFVYDYIFAACYAQLTFDDPRVNDVVRQPLPSSPYLQICGTHLITLRIADLV